MEGLSIRIYKYSLAQYTMHTLKVKVKSRKDIYHRNLCWVATRTAAAAVTHYYILGIYFP